MKSYRYIAMVLVLNFIFVWPQTPKNAYAAGNSESKINAVMVLDVSKLMVSKDPGNIRLDAIKLFIDMCRSQGDKLGMIAYGGTIAKMQELRQINAQADKEGLKNFLSDVLPQDNSDIGLGLVNAVANLDRFGSKDENNVIVLISNGKNIPHRSSDQSNNDINNSIKRAKDMGYKVYTVGLNSDGNADKELLSKIASQTDGKDFIANSSSELANIMCQIFADSSQHKLLSLGTVECSGDFQNIDIKIPNSNIVESNICVMSNNKVELKLTDNNGTLRGMPSDSVYYTTAGKYSMIKLKSPQKGVWTLGIKGTKGEKVNLIMVLNYDFQINVVYTPDSGYKVGSNIKFDVYITSNGKKIQDRELYDQLYGKIIAVMREKQRKENIELNNTGTSLTGNYKIKDKITYDIVVRVEGSGFYRESSVKCINVINSAPLVANSIDIIKIKPKDQKIINLNDIFSDSDNDKLSYYFEADKNGVADIHIDGDNMIIKPTSISSLKIKIVADDKKGGTASVETTIKVTIIDYVIYCVVGLGVILFLIILAIIIKSKSKAKTKKARRHTGRVVDEGELKGKLMVIIKSSINGEAFPPIFKNLEGIRNGTSLASIIPEIPESNEVKKIWVSIDRNNNIVFYNESNCNIVWDKEYARTRKKYVISSEEKICIELKKSLKTVNIQFIL